MLWSREGEVQRLRDTLRAANGVPASGVTRASASEPRSPGNFANSGTAKQAQQWDTISGKIAPWAGATFAHGKTTLPLELQPWGAKIVVIGSK